MFADGPFVLLDDAREESAAPTRLYRDPVSVISTTKWEEWDVCLREFESAQRAGHHLAGYWSYEAGLALEQRLRDRRPRSLPTPLLWFGIFRDYQELDDPTLLDHLPDPTGAWLGRLHPGVSRSHYDVTFDQVQAYIEGGDVYQANLTFRAQARYAGHPLALYAAVRERAKAGYGGAIFDGQNWMLSFSPELFFALKDGRITAKPMKGTAARLADADADAIVRDTLLHDPKQQAENLMIVDLLRNDLSKVAISGTVDVPELFHVESYPTIHQMTSTVTAQLDTDRDVVDILRQIFPCGSITGAPKIRAMEIIDELETDPRGIYCGSIGRIDPPKSNGHSDAAFNVAIRTFHISTDDEQDDKKLSIGLGSGIVADSKGHEEWRECLAKGEFAKVESEAPVDLIETMAFDPAHGIHRLEPHLERMKASAAALEFEFDRHAARNSIQAVTFHQEDPAVIRLMLAKSGEVAIELRPKPAPLSEPVQCRLVPMHANAADYRLHHKTSDRRVYKITGEDDGLNADVHPIFVDAAGYVTEGAIWNVFVEQDEKLLTPPLSRGVLPGVLRRELLESSKAVEADLRAEDLEGGFLLGNSVRGLVDAETVT